MVRLLCALFDPGFLQTMAVFSLLLFLPLEQRRHWGTAAIAGILLALLLGLGIQLSGGPPLELRRWVVIPHNIFVLAFSYGFFRACTRLSRLDAVYGVTCAYVIQHFIFCLNSVLWGAYGLFPLHGLAAVSVMWITALLVGGGLASLINCQLPYRGHYQVLPVRVMVMAAIVIMIAFVLSSGIYIAKGNTEVGTMALGYDLCSCALMLWIMIGQRKEVNLLAVIQTEQRLRRQMQDQYELSRDSIDIINRKCHDLKHQISALRLIRSEEQREATLVELEQSALIYDAAARTGNEVLDTVLTEKALLCEKGGIAWTCMADGGALDFLAPVDLYTMMGNALDNAIEASQRLPPERQAIRVVVRREFGSAFIQISNYYDRLGPICNGIPATIKENTWEHGYGVPSIRVIAEQYGGMVDIDTDQGIFLLTILIPEPA